MNNGPAGRSRALKWVELGLIGAGAVLLGFWAIARLDGELGRRNALAQFEAQRAAATALPSIPSTPSIPSIAPTLPAPAVLHISERSDRSLWSEKRIRAYEESQRVAFAPPMAVLRIPTAGIEVPVLPGTDDVTLNRAVGWIQGTARPGEGGNVGIAGHRDGFFRALKDVTRGDPVVLETLDGQHEYVIDDIRVVKPEDVQVLAPTAAPTVTLVTCFPFYFIGDAPQRYIVRAVAAGAADAKHAALR